MASSISITVGNTTATLPLNATNAQVAAALTRYARSLGITTTGVTADDLLAVLVHVADDIKRRSKQQQIADLAAAQAAANQTQADADNPL